MSARVDASPRDRGAAAQFARAIGAVSVHRVRSVGTGAGERAWLKERRIGMTGVIAAGNAFLRLARSGVEMLGDAGEWQAWELGCFRLAHGAEARAERHGPRGVRLGALPGRSMRELARDGALVPPAARAAGREFRRCHALELAALPGGFSHGDPHPGNVLWDAATDRARLIDFETRHDPAVLAPEARRVDDLAVFALGLLPVTAAPAWVALVAALLEGYDGCAATRARTLAALARPAGYWARVLWACRTHQVAADEVARRTAALAAALG